MIYLVLFVVALVGCGSSEELPNETSTANTSSSGSMGASSGSPWAVCDQDGVCEQDETCSTCGMDCGICYEGVPCDRFQKVTAGSTLFISGEMGDDRAGTNAGCDVHAVAPDVTVMGSWKGDLRCHHCNGWIFENLEVTNGSLRMIAGNGWSLRNSVIDGGGRGIMAVVGTGADDSSDGQATHWLIDGITSRNAGCRPPDDPYPTHVRALYVIGKNGVPNDGIVQNSIFEGAGCGATVKIGGTGNFGSWSGAPDAADSVVFRNNEIRNVGDGPQREALLLATNSDFVTVENNRLTAGEYAIVASGPWSGKGLHIFGNTIDAPVFLLARLWNNPAADALAHLYGEKFVTVHEPGPCPEVGTCENNTH